MANLNAPRGFEPVRYLNGATYNGAGNVYYIPSSDNSQYSPGDVVITAAGGDANGIPQVAKSTGTGAVRGVVMGQVIAPWYQPSLSGAVIDLTQLDVPATKLKNYYVLVADDPDILFNVQDDGLNVLTATSCNKLCSFTVANPTSPQQLSASVLTTSTIGTTNTLNCRLIGLLQRDDNNFGQYARWLVKFNVHELGQGATGV